LSFKFDNLTTFYKLSKLHNRLQQDGYISNSTSFKNFEASFNGKLIAEFHKIDWNPCFSNKGPFSFISFFIRILVKNYGLLSPSLTGKKRCVEITSNRIKKIFTHRNESINISSYSSISQWTDHSKSDDPKVTRLLEIITSSLS
ncbi:MAG: hypothetical protein WKF91_17130, partial [Segetibacter sp.]